MVRRITLSALLISLLVQVSGCCCGPYVGAKPWLSPRVHCDGCDASWSEPVVADGCADCGAGGECGDGGCSGARCAYDKGPLSLAHRHWKKSRYFGPGCGEVYWWAWKSDPPDYCDPCDSCGNWVGPTGCRRSFWNNLIHVTFGGFRGHGYGHCRNGCCGEAGCDGATSEIDTYGTYDSDGTEVWLGSPNEAVPEAGPNILPHPAENGPPT